MASGLFAIERAAIEAIIRQHPLLASALTVQLQRVVVTARTNTGAGFYTDLCVPDDAPLAITGSPIGEPFAHVEGLKHGMGFLLMVRDGKMECLEGYGFEEAVSPINFETTVFSMIDRALLD
jgi:hypothetical protein